MQKYCWILIMVLAACGQKQPTVTEKAADAHSDNAEEVVLTADQLRHAGISTGPVKDTLVSSELVVNGMVDVPPQNIVSVSFPMGGYCGQPNYCQACMCSKGN